MAKTEALTLGNLRPPRGSNPARKRKGRGPGSGLGKTAGRGTKGQRARKSGNVRPGFEGGQMPLLRRVPKRGFTNPFKVRAQVVNLKDLAKLPGEEVTPQTLLDAGLVSGLDRPVKLLGTGEADRPYRVRGCLYSASAKEKILKAGGQVED
jgi:large subunit ribosomal protein L15